MRINGVRLQGIYTGEILVTGSQGKGDGVIEYDLYGTGEGFRVTQNDDGRPATSDAAEGFTTKSLDIPVPTLIRRWLLLQTRPTARYSTIPTVAPAIIAGKRRSNGTTNRRIVNHCRTIWRRKQVHTLTNCQLSVQNKWLTVLSEDA